MNLLNLLSESTNYLGNGVMDIPALDLNWIGNIIKWLIEGIGITGLGIIVFTLILKTIVLPLDIYSRYKTKKQALIMEKMRPQMEKLQKQYANDQQMYQQKVMELQKANGYSVFSACIPMIVTLVIFMVVFSAFSAYSQYATLESYKGMVKAYNQSMQVFVYDETDNPEGFLLAEENMNGESDYRVYFDKFCTYYNAHNAEEEQDFSDENQLFISLYNAKNNTQLSSVTEEQKLVLVDEYISTPCAKAAADYYANNKNGFLWVRNIWYPDSMFNREIPDFDGFVKSVSQRQISNDYKESYEKVTAALSVEKNTYNGYFILIILAIGGMLLQQIIMNKSNKAVNDLSTVDGSAAKSNKMMMWMMPIIYGIFSFFYSAAFSIYMVTNTAYSIITTLIINKCMDKAFEKREAKAEMERYSRRPVYTKNKRK